MKVFLSWSGVRSKAIATALEDWLPYILQGIDAWMSDSDISAGSEWSKELSTELQNCSFGVLCLTPENTLSPWLLFEAGALSKSVESVRVVPYCFEIDPLRVQYPLAQFQCVGADKEGTLRLVRSLNGLLENGLDELRLTHSFERWWPDLEQSFKAIPKASSASGLELIEVKQVYCAYTEEFGDKGAETDINILESYFPKRVLTRPNVTKLQFIEDLNTSKFEILHIIARTDPERGDLYFDESGSERIKLEGLRSLVERCGAKLVFLATCNSTVSGSYLGRVTSVIAAYGDVHCLSLNDWERTFYSLLGKGRTLIEAYDQARETSDMPITQHIKSNTIFLVSSSTE